MRRCHNRRWQAGWLSLCVAAAGIAGCTAGDDGDRKPAADYILVNASARRLDPARPRAEAIAIRGNTIVHVGDNTGARALAGEATEIIDLGGRLLAAHLIIFWLSQDSNVTPPVCIVAFAAAAIARTPPMRTGLTSWKIAKGLYLVPLLFAFSPLVTGDWPERIEVFVFACFGLYALAGLLQWHLEERLNAATAALLLLSAGLCLWTPFGTAAHVGGAAVLVGVVAWQRGRGTRSSL